MTPLLAVAGLSVHFTVQGRRFAAVQGVDLAIGPNQTVALVGESGSGKSTLARAVVGLVAPSAGTVMLDGERLEGMAPRKDPRHRAAIQMVFQNPDAALNPRLTIGRLIEEPLIMRGRSGRAARRAQVPALLDQVGLPASAAVKQPHQLSGGQRQRVCIARALAAGPRLVIADEAVSALDVSVQGQILNLFAELQQSLGISYLFISHDLSVVRHVADRVAVMFFGRIVEEADRATLWRHPLHPYTRALIAAAPVADPRLARERRQRLAMLDAADAPPAEGGCAYRSRCARASAICEQETPRLQALAEHHRVACHHAAEFLPALREAAPAAVTP